MKTNLLSVLSWVVMLLATYSSKAVPAYPGLVEFKQPNGEIVKIYIHGDEYLHWATTEDGYTLLYDEEGYLAFAEREPFTGNLVPSKVRLRQPDASGRMNAPARNFLQGIEKELWFSEEQVKIARQAKQIFNQNIGNSTNRARWNQPVTGEKHFVMLLVEFQDVHFSHSKESFEKLMNQLNYHENGHFGSVRDFYQENSFGKLDLVTDVYGIYRVSKDLSYYGGTSDESGDDRPLDMFTEAVQLADSQVDFSKYDNDGDGIVDGIHIIYAGHGEEAGGGKDCIWAHSMSFSWGAKFDGKSFNRYSCSPELRNARGSKITYIGVICHEIGHVLGTLDFYDTNYQYEGRYNGTGYFDLMASGSWNGGGACPAHFNPFSKIYDFRWAEATDCNSAETWTLKAKDENSFLRIDTKTPGEFYMFEYRSQSGFDSLIPGHGMLVYHGADFIENYAQNWNNRINTTHPQGFYIVSANAPTETPTASSQSYGNLNNTAPFPGRNLVDEFTDYTAPSMRSWNGVNTDFPITSIEEDIENEKVTFDVAGGKDGGAAGFRVLDSDLTNITLSWKKKDEQKVLLVYSKTVGTGNPENGFDYAVGDFIENCGEVIYCGGDTKYVHTNLEEAEIYYYRLYTKKDDGSWTAARTISAKTQVGVIRKFPFKEDFEEGKLGLNWKSESLIGNYMLWKITNFDDLKLQARFIINSGGSNFPNGKEVSRMTLPTIDFTGYKCALLSFDYYNFMEELAIEYKASPTDEWHRLSTYQTMLNKDIEGSVTNEKKMFEYIKRSFVSLPQVSSDYQLSILVTYKGNTGTIASELESVVIDNLMIEPDFDVYVVSSDPANITNNTAFIDVKAFEGLVKVSSYGIEWSVDKQDWNKVKEQDGNTKLESLPKGSIIYYRTYCNIENDKTLYGEIKEFKTMSFSNGNGTEIDPYLIENIDDWRHFVEVINSGTDCKGLYFSIGNSFTIKDPLFASKEFNGTLDGQNFVITIQEKSDEEKVDDEGLNYESLIKYLGQNGTIKNLKVLTKKVEFESWYSAGICMNNDGVILNCSFKADEKISHDEFFGICGFNYGWIVNCEADFEAECDYMTSGICRNNCGTVTNCTAKGVYKSSFHNQTSGIVGYNQILVLPNGNRTCGLISNCVNYADFYKTPGNSACGSSMAGICSSSYNGRIENCINFGNIHGDTYTQWSYFYASILGAQYEEGGEISNCINYGDIELDCSIYGFPDKTVRAAMIGFSDGCKLYNMVNKGKIEYIDSNESVLLGNIVGINSQSVIENCFSSIESNDYYTKLFSSDNEILNTLNSENTYWTLNDKNQLSLREHELDVHITLGNIVDFGKDYINIPWYCGGENLADCKLQWRKVGENTWKEITGSNNSVNKTILTELSPKTIFEIRVAAKARTGEVLESRIDTVATLFAENRESGYDYIIENYDDLLALSFLVAHGENFLGKKIALMHDIDMNGSIGNRWQPIGSKYSNYSFQGEFDGRGHIIYDMYIETKKSHVGLFATAGGYIHDLTLRDAEIICNATACNTEGSGAPHAEHWAGVGGIVGDGSIVERCGFEGIINGGNVIGGIAGNCNIVKDSYVNAFLHGDSKTYAISGISNSEVRNSYFTGKINSDNRQVIGDGITAFTNLTENSYYNKDARKYFNLDPKKSLEADKMKEEAFFEMLNPSEPDMWIFVDGVNDGFPVLADCNQPRVTTKSAKCQKDGQVKLDALAFDGGNGNFVEKGFQYFSNTTNQQVIFDVPATTESGIRFETYVENKAIPSLGINYRAYAVYTDNDSIFGDWNEFTPDIVLPKLNLISVNYADGKGYVNYTIEVGTEDVAKFELVTVTDKGDIFNQDLDSKETKGTIVLPSYDDFPLNTFIECSLANGEKISSDSVIWGPYGIDGDANVDFRLTVTDVTTILNYILDIYPRCFSKENSDVNKDGNITVTDATIVTNMVMDTNYNALNISSTLNGDNINAVQSNLQLQMDEFSIENNVSTDEDIKLNGAENFVAAQLDVTLNGHIKIIETKVDEGHQVVWKQISENKYRLMIFSTTNEYFANSDIATLSFITDGTLSSGEIKFDNIFLDSIQGHEINEIMLKPSAAYYDTIISTGLDQLRKDNNDNPDNQYYNLKGQPVLEPQGGVYIVNGKKVIL